MTVDDNIDAVVGHSEQQVRFDDLERLVGQSGRIDRDLVAHAPRRMRERVFRGDRGELIRRQRTKRSTGCREDQPGDLLGRPADQALVDRAMLTVYRKDLSAAGPPGLEHQLAPGYERFLVRQCQSPSGLKGTEGRCETCISNQGVDDDAAFGARCGGSKLVGPEFPLAGPARLEIRRSVVGQDHEVRIEISSEFIERLCTPSRGEGHDAKPVRVPGDDANRRPADRAGCSQEGDADRHVGHAIVAMKK